MKSNYIPLLDLVEGWAAQSGELENQILTNLCNFESKGRISSEAFRHSSADGYMRQGLMSELVGQMYNSGYDIIRRDAIDYLKTINVSKSHILLLCNSYKIRPPRCAIGFWRWLLWRDYEHDTIPPYVVSFKENEIEQKTVAISSKEQEQEEAFYSQFAELEEKAMKSVVFLEDGFLKEIEFDENEWKTHTEIILAVVDRLKSFDQVLIEERKVFGPGVLPLFSDSIIWRLDNLENRYEKIKSQISDRIASNKRHRGRQEGYKKYPADHNHIRMIRLLVDRGDASSWHDGTLMIADLVDGQTLEAKVKRLREPK